jgi:hypothetical protein
MHSGNDNLYRKKRKMYLENIGELSCSRCSWHSGENNGRWVKHGKQKPKYKNIKRDK